MRASTKQKKNKKKQELPSEYHQLLKSVGAFMEYWGFKAVHGKIWAAVYLSKEPVDANFMISQLQLSKAAISLGIKDLLHYDVIREVPKNGPSTQKYSSNPETRSSSGSSMKHFNLPGSRFTTPRFSMR